ncbi:hypothetical protein A3Q56_03078, partial [Intoshia linei]
MTGFKDNIFKKTTSSNNNIKNEKEINTIDRWPNTDRKPKFLSEVEKWLKNEVELLQINLPKRALSYKNYKESYKSMLQPYQEAFDYIINNLTTYKPILSEIKLAYDREYNKLIDCLKEFEPLRKNIFETQEHFDQKLKKIRIKDNVDIEIMKKEKIELLRVMDILRGENESFAVQIMQFKKELKENYRKFNDVNDSRKLLIIEINDLKNQQNDLEIAQNITKQIKSDSSQDPVTLAVELKCLRRDEARTRQELIEMQANYSDVVSRRIYESIKNECDETKEKFKTISSELKKLTNEQSILKQEYEKIIIERDELRQSEEHLKRSATPRPNWDNLVGKEFKGGLKKWKKYSNKKTSNDKLKLILQNFSYNLFPFNFHKPIYKNTDNENKIFSPFNNKSADKNNTNSDKYDVYLQIDKNYWDVLCNFGIDSFDANFNEMNNAKLQLSQDASPKKTLAGQNKKPKTLSRQLTSVESKFTENDKFLTDCDVLILKRKMSLNEVSLLAYRFWIDREMFYNGDKKYNCITKSYENNLEMVSNTEKIMPLLSIVHDKSSEYRPDRYFKNFLMRIYRNELESYEQAYNFYQAISQDYKHISFLKETFDILSYKMDERLFWNSQIIFEKLRKEAYDLATKNILDPDYISSVEQASQADMINTYSFTKEDITTILATVFENIGENVVQEILDTIFVDNALEYDKNETVNKILGKEINNEMYYFHTLFPKAMVLSHHDFHQSVTKYIIQVRHQLVDDTLESIQYDEEGIINPDDLKRTLMLTNPGITPRETNRLIRWVFEENKELETSVVSNKLKNYDIKLYPHKLE